MECEERELSRSERRILEQELIITFTSDLFLGSMDMIFAFGGLGYQVMTF